MTTITLSRIQPNRIYKVDDLLIKLLKISKNSFVTLTATNNVDEMVALTNRLKFLPNSPRKVFFPAFTLNVTTLKPLRNATARETKYRELKEHKLPFNRLVDLSKMKALYDGKPVILDMSIYREAFNTYFEQHKKRPASSLGLLKKSLGTMIQDLPKDRMTYTLVDIGSGLDSYLQTLEALIRFSTKEAVDYLNKLRVIFYTRNGFMYFNPAYKIADKAKLLGYLNKLDQYSKVSTDIVDADVYVVTEKDLSTTEVEDVQLANKLVVDSSDSDQHHLDPDVDDGSVELSTDAATVKNRGAAEDLDENEDEGPVASTAEDSVDEMSIEKTQAEVDEDLKAVVDDSTGSVTVSTTDLREKIKKDNEAFLAFGMPLQQKALATLEKEADALAKDFTLDILDIPDETILNKNFRTVTGGSITQSYYKKQFGKDVLDIFKTLNTDPEYPMVIVGMSKRDSSTALTKSQEVSVELMDKRRRKTTFKIDVPLLSRDGFILYNGNKKFIAKQALPIPVIKETEDRVQITTNYKKTFLYRKGEKTSGQGDRILRVLLGQSFSTVKRTLGNSTTTNLKFPVSIAYNYIARKVYALIIKSGATTVDLRLNQQEIRDELVKNDIKIDLTKYIPIGYVAGGVLCEDVNTRAIYLISKVGNKVTTPNGKLAGSLIEYLTTVIQGSTDTELLEAYKATKPSISLSYTQIKIASKDLALGALIAMYKGLLPALELYKINYRVEEKRVAKKDSEVIFGFNDVYLYVDTEFKPEFEIFINGLSPLNTSLYSIGETGIFAPIFMDYLQEQTGSRNTAKALANFETSMIDPITKETLTAYNLPTNFPELLLYGNTLLGGFGHDRKNDMSHFRLRDSEVIAVAIYNTMMGAYNDYKRTMRSNIPQSINVRKDAVFRALQDMNNVEDYSTLNPFQEAEIKSKATFKGPSGLTQ